jgi:hypothetical protein
MTTFTQLTLAPPVLLSHALTGCGWQGPPTWPRFKGSSREHTESDPRCYLAW